MCGLFGILAGHGRDLEIESGTLYLCDRMAHRGPDDASAWSDASAWIGHRRPAIMDPEGGREPFVVDPESDDPCVVVFNGELLEHLELRRRLEREGRRFETGCDAETAAVLAGDGRGRLAQSFRGMFAVAWYRPARRRIWLARDPFKLLLHAVDDRGASSSRAR